MLAATSVGITARVLKDAEAVKTPFARIILGAAVIDDVLGLLVLAVISGIITAAGTGQALGWAAIGLIVLKAFVFLVGALVVGSLLSPRLFRATLALRSSGVVLALSLSLCFTFSYLALEAGLAPIVGAFAAGLVLEEVHFEGHVGRGERPLHKSLEPLIALFVPVFFVRMGMLVDVRSFASPAVLGFAALLTVAAILGKLACGLVAPKGVSRLRHLRRRGVHGGGDHHGHAAPAAVGDAASGSSRPGGGGMSGSLGSTESRWRGRAVSSRHLSRPGPARQVRSAWDAEPPGRTPGPARGARRPPASARRCPPRRAP
jgi:hypothetical protein